MKTTITGKNMVVSPGVSERVLKKTSKMERYLNPNTEIFVRLTREKNNRRTCEITVPFEGVVLRAEASNDDNLYVSIDQALAKLERQIHKHRTKLGKRLRALRAHKIIGIHAVWIQYDPRAHILRFQNIQRAQHGLLRMTPAPL